MAGQGRVMLPDDVRKIVHLLSSTEMTVTEIAERMGCSRSTIIAVNRRFQVRAYSGLRTSWTKLNHHSSEPVESVECKTEKKSA